MAGVIIAFLPIVVVLLVFQRQLVRGPHRRGGQGMTRRPVVVARRRAAAASLAACGSGESILQAGNDAAPTAADDDDRSAGDRGARARRCRRRRTPRRRATTTTTPLASLPPCPVDALDDVDGAGRDHVLARLGADIETALIELTDAVQRQPGARCGCTLENQGGYKQTIDKYVQSSQDSRPELVMLPEYMVQQIADSGSVDPGRGVHRGRAASTRRRSSTGRCSSVPTEGVQWSMPFNVSEPGPLLQQGGVRRRPGSIPSDPPVTLEELRAASQAIVDARRRRRRASPSTRASTPAAAGSSSSGSPGPASSTPTTATGGSAPATRVLYDGPLGVELLTDGAVADPRRAGRVRRRQPERAGRAAQARRPGAARRRWRSPRRRRIGTVINRARRRADPRHHERPARRRADARSGRRCRRRSSAGRRCTSSPTRATTSAAAAWDYITVPDVGASRSRRGRRRRGTCRSARTPSSSTRSRRRTRPTRGSRWPTTSSLAGADDPTALGPVLGPLLRGAHGDRRRRRRDLRRRRRRLDPRRRRRRRPTPSSPTTTPATDPPIWAGFVPGRDRPGSGTMPARIAWSA